MLNAKISIIGKSKDMSHKNGLLKSIRILFCFVKFLQTQFIYFCDISSPRGFYVKEAKRDMGG